VIRDASYVLPIRRSAINDVSELGDYLRWLDTQVELIVVDGSPPEVFSYHEAAWPGIRHVALATDINAANGKVRGVLTGLDLATNERLIIGDDDVRYDETSLRQVIDLLDNASVVRPQNYFDPLPWHARWDSARSLIARMTGGDWPGTLAVRRSVLLATNGYNGDTLFENLELVRTVRAAGGAERVAGNVFVRRLPPDARHFFSQRVRQAYDEFGRPGRLLWQLVLLPAAGVLALKRPRWLAALGALSILVAEAGRRRDGADRVFPPSTSLFAPFWLAERAICSWLALASRLTRGGIPYSSSVLVSAASPPAELEKQYARLAGEV
jgi:hypothetical protein